MNRKGLVIGLILLFIGTSIIPSTAQNIEKPSLPTSSGNWLYVGGSGPGNYTKIQDAIDNASSGDTVFVYDDSSPYYENVVINKVSVSLIGEDKNTTVIDGNKKGDVVYIEVNNVKIAGFMIQNSKAGVYMFHSTNCTITGNIISNNDNGICIFTGHNLIRRNTFQNNSCAVLLNQFCDDRVEENNFIDNTRNVQDTWNIKVVYVGNYWDTWIGLKFHGPICQRFPKFVCVSMCIPLFFFVPCLKFDWHPAQEPYDILV